MMAGSLSRTHPLMYGDSGKVYSNVPASYTTSSPSMARDEGHVIYMAHIMSTFWNMPSTGVIQITNMDKKKSLSEPFYLHLSRQSIQDRSGGNKLQTQIMEKRSLCRDYVALALASSLRCPFQVNISTTPVGTLHGANMMKAGA